MRECEREDCLLDDDEYDHDYSSTSSEPGECKWLILTGVFLSQLIFSGMLASYGVLLVQLNEEHGLRLNTAFWTPVIYTVTWCFLDPLWKKMATGENRNRSRLFAVIGVLTTAIGIAGSSLTYIPSLQMLLYGLLGGVGTSMVLMQAEVALCCHYPPHMQSSMLAHCIPQLGKALAQFAMPLVLLGFTSSYGPHTAPLLQAGLILHGLLGAITYVPPEPKPPVEPRFRYRPRAFTFIDTERQSIINRDNYINRSYSECSWKNPSSHSESSEVRTSPETMQSNIRCNKNQHGVDILPEIPEESEVDDESNYSNSINFRREEQEKQRCNYSPDTPLPCGAKSLGDIVSDSTVKPEITKRWSIGVVDEIVPIHIENGLAQISGHVKDVIAESGSQTLDDWGSVNVVSLDEIKIHSRSIDLCANDMLSSAKSLDYANFSIVEKERSSEIDDKYLKVRSLDNVVSVLVHSQENSIKHKSYEFENFDALDPLAETSGTKEQNRTFLRDREACEQITLLDQTSCPGKERQRWSIGSVDEIFSVNSRLSGNSPANCQEVNSRKWHSAEFPIISYPFESAENNYSQEIDEGECSSPVSTGSDRPLWPKNNSKETFHIQGKSESNKVTVSQVLRILRNSFGCRYCHRKTFRKSFPQNQCTYFLWAYLDSFTIPYFFPCLLLRFTLRFCPMGFAALTPCLVTYVIEDTTVREAVFSVSVSGFVWLCYLLMTPWCIKLRPTSRKYLFATGNLVAAFSLHFLSKAETHERVTLGCAIFGLGQGITMATGMTVMRESLGSWNFNKVDNVLDIASAFLVLATAAIMGVILKDKENLGDCFILMAVIYLVTGVTWLLRPLITSIQCNQNAHSDWSTNGGHLLSSG